MATPAALAEELLDALDSGRLVERPSEGDPGFDLEAAYAVGDLVHARRVARGERAVGRKLGFTNPALLERFGLAAPVWAPVYDTTTVEAADGRARVELAGMVQPRLEPEIQLHLAAAPPRGADEEAILACVDWIALGFELVRCPYPDWSFEAPDMVAAAGFHAELVIGPRVAVADDGGWVEKLRACTVELARDGVVEQRGGGATALGSPLRALAASVDALPDGESIAAGEVVTTGTLTPPPPAAPGETWRLAAAGIELPAVELELA